MDKQETVGDVLAEMNGVVERDYRAGPHMTQDWHTRIQAAHTREVEALRVDARRLDWLDRHRGDDVRQVGHDDFELVAHYWTVGGQCGDVRSAIDAAIAARERATKAAPPHAAWMDDVCGAGKDLPGSRSDG